MIRFIVAVVAFALLCATVGASARALHCPCDDATGYQTWHWTSSVPTSWHQALTNGTQVWDNVPYQCHDFQRVTAPNGQIPQWPTDNLDGPHGLFARATNHTNIKYDSTENWHTNTATYPPVDRLDLWSIAAHENGHTLQLIHRTEAHDGVYPTMYAEYAYGYFWFRSLELDDRQRIQSLYGNCA